ncbi:hypothetical protein [Anabaena catenula]|uniref:Outer membrane protein beta-barrel domain-containing protein n=1 Tax=Anabaena catenula FACHB-362 TaxID=2692877 RepID=A0ABR8IXG2_9NOST|nr:hypothetical protein [Anabaena catenula]MBD2690269.1 hypothetical protein [Anabaena catenula FACHB-362]
MFLRKNLLCLPSLAALAVLGSSLSANAQTPQPIDSVMSDNQVNAESTAATLAKVPALTNTSTDIIPVFETGATELAANIMPDSEVEAESTATNFAEVPQFPNAATEKTPSRTIIPVPGTVATSSMMLTDVVSESTSQPSAAQVAQPNQIAQSDIDVGRSTRGGSSYVGVGANIGLSGGSTALGDGNFAVISKIGFTRSLSIRPSVILGDNTLFLIPITYDFSFQQVGDPFTERLPIAPYVGVGAAIQTGDNSETAVLVTGGIDVPLNNRFTATASVNAGFFNQTDVGLLLGVGYNFGGF